MSWSATRVVSSMSRPDWFANVNTGIAYMKNQMVKWCVTLSTLSENFLTDMNCITQAAAKPQTCSSGKSIWAASPPPESPVRAARRRRRRREGRGGRTRAPRRSSAPTR
ncbi:Os01g0200350 [Oryza sativa Japonica Group]|uniref:Os01g0200350 protein n=1 Tax=Oryza sativa subsp. japonica TaxID=39947 RepID=A0A0P0UZB6_ORYSJ|nr:hypothetical protein EE612_000867 [Oryza sativa]BAS70901.1 Os01g0200350 [Oryza sativa Japonica Group]